MFAGFDDQIKYKNCLKNDWDTPVSINLKKNQK